MEDLRLAGTTSARETERSKKREHTATRQNRTTVNGSSLQSSYFLTMVGHVTSVCACACAYGTRRIESPRERTARSNRKTVLFLIARPACLSTLHRGALARPIETAERLRTRDPALYAKRPGDFRADFSIDLGEIAV